MFLFLIVACVVATVCAVGFVGGFVAVAVVVAVVVLVVVVAVVVVVVLVIVVVVAVVVVVFCCCCSCYCRRCYHPKPMVIITVSYKWVTHIPIHSISITQTPMLNYRPVQ